MFRDVRIAQGKDKGMVSFWDVFDQEYLLYKANMCFAWLTSACWLIVPTSIRTSGGSRRDQTELTAQTTWSKVSTMS